MLQLFLSFLLGGLNVRCFGNTHAQMIFIGQKKSHSVRRMGLVSYIELIYSGSFILKSSMKAVV